MVAERVAAAPVAVALADNQDWFTYGAQDVSAERFGERRTVTSGSWLTLDAHGNGYGRLMRQAMLVLAFDHLGALRAESAAVVGNAPSYGVSRACGYIDNGTEISTISMRAAGPQQ